MGHRADSEREERLQPRRMAGCKQALEEKGFEITVISDDELDFVYRGHRIKFWPYSGWHTGKTIQDGRGFKHLVEQLL